MVEFGNRNEVTMEPTVNSLFNDAIRLPIEEQKKLAEKLLRNTRPARTGRGDITKYFGLIDSGDPRSGDNEKIDADLAREYGNNHKPEK